MSLRDDHTRADERAKTIAAELETMKREMEAALAVKEEELADAIKVAEDLIIQSIQEVGIASVLDPAHDDLATLVLTSDMRIGAFALRDMFREAGLGMGTLSTNLTIPFPTKKDDALDTAAAFIATIMRVRAAKGEEARFAFSAQTAFNPEFPERGWLHRFILHATKDGFLLRNTKEEEATPVSTIREGLAHIESMMEALLAPVREKEEYAPHPVEHAASIHSIEAAREARKHRRP